MDIEPSERRDEQRGGRFQLLFERRKGWWIWQCYIAYLKIKCVLQSDPATLLRAERSGLRLN